MTTASLAAIRLSEATRRLHDLKAEVARLENEAQNAYRAENMTVMQLYSYVAQNGIISELSHLSQAYAGILDSSPATTTTLDDSPEAIEAARGEWGF